jgi:Ufm1-specific protease 1
VPCRLIHINRSETIVQYKDALVQYFKEFGCLIMMGGDLDASSKGIAGIRWNANDVDLLVVVGITNILK